MWNLCGIFYLATHAVMPAAKSTRKVMPSAKFMNFHEDKHLKCKIFQ
jgi:hypothetical protein